MAAIGSLVRGYDKWREHNYSLNIEYPSKAGFYVIRTPPCTSEDRKGMIKVGRACKTGLENRLKQYYNAYGLDFKILLLKTFNSTVENPNEHIDYSVEQQAIAYERKLLTILDKEYHLKPRGNEYFPFDDLKFIKKVKD